MEEKYLGILSPDQIPNRKGVRKVLYAREGNRVYYRVWVPVKVKPAKPDTPSRKTIRELEKFLRNEKD